jgi:hypothetical protein
MRSHILARAETMAHFSRQLLRAFAAPGVLAQGFLLWLLWSFPE